MLRGLFNLLSAPVWAWTLNPSLPPCTAYIGCHVHLFGRADLIHSVDPCFPDQDPCVLCSERQTGGFTMGGCGSSVSKAGNGDVTGGFPSCGRPCSADSTRLPVLLLFGQAAHWLCHVGRVIALKRACMAPWLALGACVL